MKIEKQHNVPNLDTMGKKELHAFSNKYKNCIVTYARQLVGEKYQHQAMEIAKILAMYANNRYCLLIEGITDSFKKVCEQDRNHLFNRIPRDLRW